MQEGVVESQRGVVNGVQSALNRSLDLLKFFLVVLIPSVEGFGYLILLSWTAILLGYHNFLLNWFVLILQL